jgi:hypothetical protein
MAAVVAGKARHRRRKVKKIAHGGSAAGGRREHGAEIDSRRRRCKGNSLREKTPRADTKPSNPRASKRKMTGPGPIVRVKNQKTKWIRTKNQHGTMRSSNPKIKQNRKHKDITQAVKIEIFH